MYVCIFMYIIFICMCFFICTQACVYVHLCARVETINGCSQKTDGLLNRITHFWVNPGSAFIPCHGKLVLPSVLPSLAIK